MIVVPDQRVGAYIILRSAAAQALLLVSAVFKILKADLFSLIDSIGDRIHSIVDLTVVRLDPIRHVEMPPDLLRLGLAHHAGQFFDQDCALLPADESRRGDRVDQKFDLRDLKLAVRQKKRILCASDRNDVESFADENVYIILYRFPGVVRVFRLKDLYKLRCRNRMILICIFIQILEHSERSLLIADIGHKASS